MFSIKSLILIPSIRNPTAGIQDTKNNKKYTAPSLKTKYKGEKKLAIANIIPITIVIIQ